MSARRARRTRVLLESSHWTQVAARTIVVVKIGGSLLTSARLIRRLEWLLAELEDYRVLLICGGGKAADTVRRWQQAHGLSDESAHWLALSAVTFNESLLQSALHHSVIAERVEDIETAWQAGEQPILGCEEFLRNNEPVSADPLPHNWNTTSDSIAGWCARHIGADELLLAKSTDLSEEMSLSTAAAHGLVDRSFPDQCNGLSLSWVNLRSPSPSIVTWNVEQHR